MFERTKNYVFIYQQLIEHSIYRYFTALYLANKKKKLKFVVCSFMQLSKYQSV